MVQTKMTQHRAGNGSTARLTGEPIMRIRCKKTDALVGFLYRWNNGDLQPAWLTGALAEVHYEPMIEAA